MTGEHAVINPAQEICGLCFDLAEQNMLLQPLARMCQEGSEKYPGTIKTCKNDC